MVCVDWSRLQVLRRDPEKRMGTIRGGQVKDRRKALRMRAIVDLARNALNEGASTKDAANLLRMEFVPLHVALRIVAGRIV
jgi:hypothetical protein